MTRSKAHFDFRSPILLKPVVSTMKAGHFALLVSILIVTVYCHCKSFKFFSISYSNYLLANNNNNNNNKNQNNNKKNNVWKSYPGFDKKKWNNLSWYLKKLPQKQFFGMRFILNVTGESCIPQWNWPKPKCWGGGWPWVRITFLNYFKFLCFSLGPVSQFLLILNNCF